MKRTVFILYGLILLGLSFFSYAFIDPNLIYYKNIYSGFAFQNKTLVTILYLCFIALLFVSYLFIIKSVNRKRFNSKDVRFLIGITCVGLFFSYPAMLSYDIFNYLTTAKVLFFHHENPYLIMPIEFLGDPFLLFTHAANKLALYGPVWILFSGVPHFLGAGNFIVTLMSFKLVALIFYVLTVLLIWKLAKNLYVVSLFAFNPLIILESLLSSHNDIIMVFLVLLSFFLMQNKKYLLALLIFGASILIKYATLILLPIFIFMLWKNYKGKDINWKNIYYFSFLSMLIIFLLSPLREEMYPWYAVWFLPFIFLIPEKKNILYLSIAFSFGLLLRYAPFMYSGTHFGITPLLKIVLASLPVVIVGFSILSSRPKWRNLLQLGWRKIPRLRSE